MLLACESGVPGFECADGGANAENAFVSEERLEFDADARGDGLNGFADISLLPLLLLKSDD